MASFGAKRPIWAPILTQPKGELPTYGEVQSLGRLVKAERSINYASGKLHADDELVEDVNEFVSGAIAEETDDILDEVAGEIYGSDITNGVVSRKTGDTPPYGGHAYYKVLMRDGKKYYKGYYYPKVKATLGNDTAQSKSDSITFGTALTSLTVFACNSGEWCIEKTCNTEAEVIAWCDEMLGVTE